MYEVRLPYCTDVYHKYTIECTTWKGRSVSLDWASLWMQYYSLLVRKQKDEWLVLYQYTLHSRQIGLPGYRNSHHVVCIAFAVVHPFQKARFIIVCDLRTMMGYNHKTYMCFPTVLAFGKVILRAGNCANVERLPKRPRRN